MSANLIRALLLIACVAGLHAGLVRVSSSRAPCPDFTTKPDFDYLQYAGTWYEIQKIPNVFEEGLDCVRAQYDEIGPNEISVVNSGIFSETGEISIITGTAKQPFPETQPGFLIVSFPGRPNGTYFVLDTDYVSFTAVYDCSTAGAFKFEYAWLMGRENTMTPETLRKAQAAYTSQGIDISTFANTVHNDQCPYLP